MGHYTMYQILLLHFIMLYIVIVYIEAISLNWTVISSPAVFGSSIELECYMSDKDVCVYNGTWKWTGGRNKNIIALKTTTSNSSKYTANVNSCSSFSLIIYDFDVLDVNCFYACELDFIKKKKLLALENYPFEYHPGDTDITVKKFFSHKTLYYNMSIAKVYPEPVCRIFYSHKELTNYSRSFKYTTGIFFRVQFKIYFKLTPEDCKGELDIWCKVGQTKIQIGKENLNNCYVFSRETKTADTTNNAVILEGIGVTIGFIIVVGIVLACIYYSKCGDRCNSSEVQMPLTTDTDMTETPL